MRNICYKKHIRLVHFAVSAAPQHWLQGWICQLSGWFCAHHMLGKTSLTWAATNKWLDEQEELGLVRLGRAFSSVRQVKLKRWDTQTVLAVNAIIMLILIILINTGSPLPSESHTSVYNWVISINVTYKIFSFNVLLSCVSICLLGSVWHPFNAWNNYYAVPQW